MFYPTNIDDETTLLLEAEASGAFMKSDMEVAPDPLRAFVNAVELARTVSAHIADTFKPTLREKGMDAEVDFSIRCDAFGGVMLAQDSMKGQIVCKLTIRPD